MGGQCFKGQDSTMPESGNNKGKSIQNQTKGKNANNQGTTSKQNPFKSKRG